MGNKKRPRLSLLSRTVFLLLLTLVLSCGTGLLLARKYVIENAVEHSYTVASGAVTAVMTSLGSKEGFYELFSNEEFRKSVRETLHFICRRTETTGLYLYTVDEDHRRQYIVTASDEDELDEYLRDNFGLGIVEGGGLYNAELRVLEGDVDGETEYVTEEGEQYCLFVYPLRENGQVFALISAAYDMNDILEESNETLYSIMVLVILIFSMAMISAIILMRRSIFVPVNSLSERMRSFISNIDRTFPEREAFFEDEITDMESSFHEMTGNMREYVEEIRTLTSDKVQVQTQLDVARRIQSGLIPMEQYVLGDGYEICGIEKPARAVGGDFYDIFRLDNSRICAVIGDISGKGVSAAMFMVMVKTGIRENLKGGRSPRETFSFLNREICFSNPENMFATVAILILDTQTGVVQYVNGGHESPLLLSETADYLELNGGCALGLFNDAKAGEQEIRLKDGEGLLLFTDGVTEAADPERKQFGKSRLRELAMRHYPGHGNRYDSEALVKDIKEGIKDFCKEAEQFDDITCTALIFHDNAKERRRLTMDLASLPVIRETILGSVKDEERAKLIILVCEEIFTNIVNYSKATEVSFYCERTEKLYSVSFFDDGIPFDPVTCNLRDKSFEELDSGGMGIKLARMNTKEMVYNRTEGINQLVLRFDIM